MIGPAAAQTLLALSRELYQLSVHVPFLLGFSRFNHVQGLFHQQSKWTAISAVEDAVTAYQQRQASNHVAGENLVCTVNCSNLLTMASKLICW